MFSKNKKQQKPDKATLLKEQLLQRINSIEEQIFEGKIEDGFIHLFHVIREFFTRLFKIRYEFTYKELIKEFGKKKKISPESKEKIKIFSDHLSVIEYSDSILSKQLLRECLGEFKYIVRILTTKQKKIIPEKKIKPSKLQILREHTLKFLHALKLYKTESEKLEGEGKKKKKRKRKRK